MIDKIYAVHIMTQLGISGQIYPLRLQVFLRASPSGTPSVVGVYLTVYPSFRPNTETVWSELK